MKISFLILILLIVSIPLLMALSTNRIEKQKYRVVKKERDFEIRYYPSAIFATIRSSAKSYRELSSSGFRKIAGYIFGNNESGSKIAMTSPVHMDINNRESSMSFVMPSEFEIEKLPRPADQSVEIHQSPAEYTAAIEFGGYANDEKIQAYANQLIQALNKKGIKAIGNVRYLGYNPPYQFVGRKNEVIVAIEWKER
ncbi:MAG: SOUL family heme-binding protein [Chitinophagaceae bacterium]|jgi:hypothetical protein